MIPINRTQWLVQSSSDHLLLTLLVPDQLPHGPVPVIAPFDRHSLPGDHRVELFRERTVLAEQQMRGPVGHLPVHVHNVAEAGGLKVGRVVALHEHHIARLFHLWKIKLWNF